MSDTSKPAYFVVCGTFLGGTLDPEYAKRAAAPAEKAQLKEIAGGAISQQVKVLEGELPPGSTFFGVDQFPSMAALEEFYFSDAYQSAITFRKDSVKMNFLIAVDGISDAEREAQKQAALAAAKK